MAKSVDNESDLFPRPEVATSEKEPSSGIATEPLEFRELGEAVARRTRSLIAPAPLLELEANKVQREQDLSKHDLRMLCLVLLDVVIDKMGFGTGATRRDLESALSLILRAAEPMIHEEDERRIVRMILDTLLNERGRRQQFVERYAAMDGDEVSWREFAYRLLEETQTEEGERVFRASSEAINLYTVMLGYLRAENPKYPNLIPAEELVIQGVFRGLIRTAVRSKA